LVSYTNRTSDNMPEGPELRIAANFINQVASKHLFTGKVIKSDLATKLVEVPFEAETYSLQAESRGKELKVHLDPQNDDTQKKSKKKKSQDLPEQSVKHVLFRFGMSGCFKLTSVKEIPKHAHLRFFSKDGENVLSFVDYRRFGRWTINGDWGSDRGPDSIVEYKAFRQNVLDNLKNVAFNKAICETLLNQKFFNGIGNYLRAEILYRCQIPPFAQSRSVLEPLLNNIKTEEPDILELCHIVQKEVLSLSGGKGYDVEKDPEKDYSAFNKWLQCYYKDGMENLVDHNGRTMWFSGPPGPMKPTNSKSRGKRSPKKKKENQLETDDHDYSPKKAKKAENGTKKAAKGSKKAANGPVKEETSSVEANIQTAKTENGSKKAANGSKKAANGSKKAANGSVKAENSSVEAGIQSAKAEMLKRQKATKVANKKPTKSPKTEKVANPSGRVTRSTSQD